jgi:acyl-CoA synthetase (AMP-forming)/AMP-acid ligase II
VDALRSRDHPTELAGGPALPATFNIATSLAELARNQPDLLALIEPRGTHRPAPTSERRWTYGELDRESDVLARGLLRAGLRRGTRAVLMVPPSLEFYALTHALLKLGAVLVLVDPGMGVRHLGRCLGEAEPEVFIGITRAQLAGILLGWARKTIRLRVTLGPRLFWGGPTLGRVHRAGAQGDPVLADTRADEVAAVLFTSGSTGVAKGVVYTHQLFAAQIEMLRKLYDFAPHEIDLATFPLFGLFATTLGMTTVLPEMDVTRPGSVDPRRIFNTIRHYRVSNLFGSPALLRQVAFSAEAKGLTLPTLRRVISAGAPVPDGVIRRVVELLTPGIQVYTPYGATEALPVSSIGSDEILRETARAAAEGKGVCVGQPVAGAEVRIIRVSDDPLPVWSDEYLSPPGEVGEIVVRGSAVTRSYYNRPHSTALHKMAGPEPGSVWHRMGDLGYLDERGRIWFCGRKSQRLITPEGTLYTTPCEGVFNTHPAVLRTALVGVTRGGLTVPVLCVEIDPALARRQRPDRDAAALARFRDELRQVGSRYPHTRRIQTFLIHPSFPVDTRHNAKIFREKLAQWAARRTGMKPPPEG